jgi:hypothetical protein
LICEWDISGRLIIILLGESEIDSAHYRTLENKAMQPTAGRAHGVASHQRSASTSDAQFFSWQWQKF